VTLVLRANNRGEGGIIALLALAAVPSRRSRVRARLLAIGTFGAALFYGDAVLTPAISVLSASKDSRWTSRTRALRRADSPPES
jgi:KUP system potassium uptake protein